MPVYAIRCPNCGEREIVARMREAAWSMPCDQCGRPRPQVVSAPQFQQDNLRLWRGPMGNGYSHALGAFMPDSRAERDRLAKAKGVEFCSLAELRADSKEAAGALDYYEHVQAGGARDDPAPNHDPTVWKEAP